MRLSVRSRREAASLLREAALPLQHAPATSAAPENHSLAAGPSHWLRQMFLPTATGTVVLGASLLNYLGHNNYPALTPEVAIVAAGIIILAAGVAAIYVASSKISRTLLEYLLVYIALDLNFDGLGVILGAAGTVLVLRRALLPALCVMFTVVFFTEIVGLASGVQHSEARASTSATPKSDAPVLLHLILDEHVGIEGFPQGLPQAAVIRRELKDFYLRRGFRLSGGAYSEYMRTTNAIPQILNFGDEQPWRPEHRRRGRSLRQNAYFDRLGALGYRIHVYESDFLDYCDHESVRSCTKYRAADLRLVADSPLDLNAKASLLLYGFVSLSDLAVAAAHNYDRLALVLRLTGIELPLLAIDFNKLTSTLSALSAFDRLIADLAHAQPGEAYFAHLLLPHYPYAADAKCAVKSWDEWVMRRSVGVAWRDRQLAYFDQLRCTTVKVDLALQVLARSPAGRKSIIVVHGDHGSRINRLDPLADNLERGLNEDDLIASYSTLFAARAAGLTPGYDDVRRPVAGLLSGLVASGFGERDPDLELVSEPSVTLENRSWMPVRRHKLPKTWAAGSRTAPEPVPSGGIGLLPGIHPGPS